MYGLNMIRVHIAEQIALVTLDNPPVNAQDLRFQEQVKACFDRLSDDADVRVVVLTGAGRVFSAGADLKASAGLSSAPGKFREALRSARESYHSIVECRKPVIGAINGPALGAGLALAASCDILIASETASLGLPEIDVGLMGGGRHAMRLFGHSRTRRMAFTGYRVPGLELYRLGVVEACVPSEDLLSAAMTMAREIAAKSPLALQLFKHSLNTIEEMSLRDGYRYEQDMTLQISATEDAKEAALAFIEKRQPVFQ
jgi:enoyl-CoA hydratase/carnithine racemase